MKTVNVTQFQHNCLKFINDAYLFHTELIITNDTGPVAKLVALSEKASQMFLGSLVGVGESLCDLTEPFTDEWEVD